jgi:hypothetical protein
MISLDHRLTVTVLLLFSESIIITRTCSVRKITTAKELVFQAHAIVRAKAVNYEKTPDNLTWWTNGIPTSIIRFRIEEIVKGDQKVPNMLLIPGYLNQYDDFNDHPVPYSFVRSNGRSGSCLANTYKQNASFLLFLNDKYTPYWDALAPVNEQLHSPPSDDKWLQWVKKQVPTSVHGPMINQFVTNGANKLRLFFF